MTTKKTRVIQYGLGPIGLATANLILTKSDMEIVGAVDIAKEMDSVGGMLNAFTGREYTCFYAKVIPRPAFFAGRGISSRIKKIYLQSRV